MCSSYENGAALENPCLLPWDTRWDTNIVWMPKTLEYQGFTGF